MAMGGIFVVSGIALLVDLFHGLPNTVTGGRALADAVAFFGFGGLGLLYLSLWRSNVRLLIGQHQVGYQDIFRHRRYWTPGQIDRAVDMAVIYTKNWPPQRALYLLGPSGKRVLGLNTAAWDGPDIQRFVQATGVMVDRRDKPLTAAEARRQFPNAFGWATEHVMLGTVATMIAGVLLALGGYLLWTVALRN